MYAAQRFRYAVTSTSPTSPSASCQIRDEREDYRTTSGNTTPQNTPTTGWSSNTTPQDAATLKNLASTLRTHAARINKETACFLDALAEFDAHQGWKLDGARSCSHWLSWQCDLGDVAAREHVRVARVLVRHPRVREHFHRGDLSFSKIRAITRVMDSSNEDVLLNMALRHATHILERKVRQYRHPESEQTPGKERERANWQHEHRFLSCRWREDGCLHVCARLTPEQGALFLKALEDAESLLDNAHPSRQESQATHARTTPSQRRSDAACLIAEAHLDAKGDARLADRYQVVVNADIESLRQTVGDTPDSRRCQIDPGPAIATDTARRICCDASYVQLLSDGGEPLAIGRKSPVVPNAIRRAVLFRDEHCCQFPGCGATRYLDCHHVQHWADGGATSVDNLVTLCRTHHRLLHEGGYQLKINPEAGDRHKPRYSRQTVPAEALCKSVKGRGIIDDPACGSVIATYPPPAIPRLLFVDSAGVEITPMSNTAATAGY